MSPASYSVNIPGRGFVIFAFSKFQNFQEVFCINTFETFKGTASHVIPIPLMVRFEFTLFITIVIAAEKCCTLMFIRVFSPKLATCARPLSNVLHNCLT